MSKNLQDIRSFFSVISKKSGSSTPQQTKKRPVIQDSSDEDVVKDTPTPKKKEVKKRKAVVIDSDSDSEKPKKSKVKTKVEKKKKETLKPVNPSDLFGTAPVKQTKVEKPKNEKKDDDFEKTLQQLDDDDFEIDVDELDKTIDNAIKDSSEAVESKVNGKEDEVLTLSKKRKAEESLNDSGLDPDQERYEKRRYSAMLYQKYLKREKPANMGNKELPKGKPDCLKNLCFLKTGVLDSLDSVAMDALVKEHGGRTVSSVSKKVNYLVVGDDPGPAKIEKARGLGLKEITEDELLDMILVRSGLPPKYVKKNEDDDFVDKPSSALAEAKTEKKSAAKEKAGKESAEKASELKTSKNKEEKKSHHKDKEDKSSSKLLDKKKPDDKIEIKPPKKEKFSPKKVSDKKPPVKSRDDAEIKQERPANKDLPLIERKPVVISESSKSWTEKYKPDDIKSVIGQQGPQSVMHKLCKWLKHWHMNHSTPGSKSKLTKPSPWAKNDDGAFFKCALLSGSPGVGKTTMATLVSKDLGFDVVEFNASDTRSKKLLKEEVAQILGSTSISSFAKGGSAPTQNRVLLMDEVDGMAGNEDRGGMQELISLIKDSKIPVICMCNDRQHPKVRSLANHCFDLRVTKPRLEQIRGAMMSICFKEGLKITPDAMAQVIEGSGMDIRQILNNLSMWTAADKHLTVDVAQKESQASKKDVVLGPWEVIRKVFSKSENKDMSVSDKAKLFFTDYSIGPLFVQENYLQVIPDCSKKDVLERVAMTADAISMGDVIESQIRSSNNWSLLESQAIYSSVLPGFYMQGHFGGQINFPGWLGKNSKRTKFQRMLSELQAHMRTSMSGSKQAVNLDYIYHLRTGIVSPLADKAADGIPQSLSVMQSYNLLREDLDGILELAQWPKQKDPMAAVDSRVKAAFTRAYNKDSALLPYSSSAVNMKKKKTTTQENAYGEEDEEVSEEENSEDITKDAMIKEKKKTASTKDKKDAGEGTSKKTTKTKAAKPRAKKPK